MTVPFLRGLALSAALLLLVGCVSTPPGPAPIAKLAPAQWHAPLPHEGQPMRLTQWWRGQGDALLAALIDAAQAASPDMASARARRVEAQAARVAAGAALVPTLDGQLSTSKGNALSGSMPSSMLGGLSIPPLVTTQAALQAGWEIDLFGAVRANRAAAQAQLEARQAQWHAARVSVAADTALAYFNERACRRQADVLAANAASSAETTRLAELAAQAGFQAVADVQRARAGAAGAAAQFKQQRAACAVMRQGLAALTGIDAAALEAQLDAAPPEPDLPALGSISAVPAQTLLQRPDLYAAERAVMAASAQVGVARAQQLPRLTLQGNIGRLQYQGGTFSESMSTWSFGPLALSLPIFDAGRKAAQVEAARARYDEAVSLYRASVRQAVREVEQALVNLDSIDARTTDARTAVDNAQGVLAATQLRYDAGMASLLELEDARRPLLSQRSGLVDLQRQRAEAFVALYRAMGGGWSRAEGGDANTAGHGDQNVNQNVNQNADQNADKSLGKSADKSADKSAVQKNQGARPGANNAAAAARISSPSLP
ncbi:MAG: efflux transporter outer membrane subunit [Burkholderiaceae bacterium]|jgi:NodT family efflux transporter outer membrane factor (OMF) lipoprotein|nr:efflux transporter outer membrane subunit [Burkholderiaceae bacterium]